MDNYLGQIHFRNENVGYCLIKPKIEVRAGEMCGHLISAVIEKNILKIFQDGNVTQQKSPIQLLIKDKQKFVNCWLAVPKNLSQKTSKVEITDSFFYFERLEF